MQRGLIVACAQLRRVPAEILCIGMSNVKIKEGSCMSHNAPAPPTARLSQTRNPRGVWNITAGDNNPATSAPGDRCEGPAAATAGATGEERFIVPLISGVTR